MLAKRAQTERMCAFTPKISCSTTTAPRRLTPVAPPAGAFQQSNAWPSCDVMRMKPASAAGTLAMRSIRRAERGAAIDDDLRAGDEAGGRRSEEQRGALQVLRRRDAAER